MRIAGISSTGLLALGLLAVQNCSKNLIMRAAVKSKPEFLLSVAVFGSEMTKVSLSVLWILFVERGSLLDIARFLKNDWRNAVLLIVPAAVYNLQQTLEYVALANLDAAIFSVLVQTKLLTTATFSVSLLGKKLRKSQVISLVLLTVGVMLANLKCTDGQNASANSVGVVATLGIAAASGFAAVYTEKVIKSRRGVDQERQKFSLAYMQVQLALVSMVIMGAWALVKDFSAIQQKGLFYDFGPVACISIFTSGIGGLLVAAVLKFADSVLKGYATAISVLLTGVFSMMLFGTQLSSEYGLGMVVIICSTVLYNAQGLDANIN